MVRGQPLRAGRCHIGVDPDQAAKTLLELCHQLGQTWAVLLRLQELQKDGEKGRGEDHRRSGTSSRGRPHTSCAQRGARASPPPPPAPPSAASHETSPTHLHCGLLVFPEAPHRLRQRAEGHPVLACRVQHPLGPAVELTAVDVLPVAQVPRPQDLPEVGHCEEI